jgi:hypothetical protein
MVSDPPVVRPAPSLARENRPMAHMPIAEDDVITTLTSQGAVTRVGHAVVAGIASAAEAIARRRRRIVPPMPPCWMFTSRGRATASRWGRTSKPSGRFPSPTCRGRTSPSSLPSTFPRPYGVISPGRLTGTSSATSSATSSRVRMPRRRPSAVPPGSFASGPTAAGALGRLAAVPPPTHA